MSSSFCLSRATTRRIFLPRSSSTSASDIFSASSRLFVLIRLSYRGVAFTAHTGSGIICTENLSEEFHDKLHIRFICLKYLGRSNRHIREPNRRAHRLRSSDVARLYCHDYHWLAGGLDRRSHYARAWLRLHR